MLQTKPGRDVLHNRPYKLAVYGLKPSYSSALMYSLPCRPQPGPPDLGRQPLTMAGSVASGAGNATIETFSLHKVEAPETGGSGGKQRCLQSEEGKRTVMDETPCRAYLHLKVYLAGTRLCIVTLSMAVVRLLPGSVLHPQLKQRRLASDSLSTKHGPRSASSSPTKCPPWDDTQVKQDTLYCHVTQLSS